MRIIEGQNTLLARTVHQLAIDSVHDEIVAPNPFAEAILFFRGGANGEEAPIRIIQGPKTMLGYSDNIEVDPQHNEVFMAQSRTNTVLVFDREAKGDVAPKRILQGPRTRLNRPRKTAVDPVNDLLVVTNGGDPEGLLFFKRSDSGDVEPQGILSGPKTEISREHRAGEVVLYPEGKKIFVTMSRRVGDPREGNRFASVAVWNYGDMGDVPPWAIFKGRRAELKGSMMGIALNPKAKELMVAHSYNPPSLLVYHVPELLK